MMNRILHSRTVFLIFLVLSVFMFSMCEFVPVSELAHTNPYDSEHPVEETSDYTVTFQSNGGTDITSQTITEGGLVNEPAEPARSGYSFAGWYKESGLENLWVFASDTVMSDITLYAKWNDNTVIPPSTPSAVAVAAGGDGTLTVTWDAVSGADSYKVVHNGINDSSTAVVVDTGLDPDQTDTQAIVTGLTNGGFYYLWVSAANAGGSSGYSTVTRCVPVAEGTDHAGGDIAISSGQELGGVHYNVGTFTVDSGITLTVTAYDGSDPQTGSLTVYAQDIDIQGTISATGAGYGGGGGGGGGAGGGSNNSAYQAGGSPGSGTHGSSTGNNGSAVGAAVKEGGNGGNGGSGDGPSGGSGGNGGGGGAAGQSIDETTGYNGSAGSQGSAGGTGTYSAVGSTGENEIVDMGSGGGGGAGGGGGGGLAVNGAVYGGGGAGGGAGGNGGGLIRLCSFGSLTMTGAIQSNGSSGGSGGSISGSARTAGTGGSASGGSGGQGFDNYGNDVWGRNGGSGAAGRVGGTGSGGAVLLKGVDIDLNGAPVTCYGPSSNNGVIKIFYENAYTTGSYTGTSYENQFGL